MKTLPTPRVSSSRFWGLTLGSVGVVYGDIGTSPLYAFRELIAQARNDGIVTAEEVYGVLSLILWALLLIVTIKYVLILLRAHNNGEGGTLSLMALARSAPGRIGSVVVFLGLIGAALFYGDAMITPAISVLSAVEGLKLVTPAFEAFVLPITVVIIIVLFAVQSRGTARVAAFFGPITTIWFAVLLSIGIMNIADHPDVLFSFLPHHALNFLFAHGKASFLALGAVFLAVTGAEALYADLGHFGRGPIQAAWLGLVFPSLAVNYLGQGALVLAHPDAIADPFFLMVPHWALVPLVLLATMATIIASQAVITGAYSLSQQAIQLGLLPRLEIIHTSATQLGQIYMPQINTILMLGVLFLVAMFKSSGNLASAYGIAVSGTMVVTALMAFVVIWKVWNWHWAAAAALILPFLVVDATFLSANMLKVLQGGWAPLLLGILLMTVMISWQRGMAVLRRKTRREEVPLPDLLRSLEKRSPHRVKGTAIFLTNDPAFSPTALLHNLKHNKVLHERNVILTIAHDDVPRLAEKDRTSVESLSRTFVLITLHFGYMEIPDVPKALRSHELGWRFDMMDTTFFLSRRWIRQAAKSQMPKWQEKLFIGLVRNASSASEYFQLPTGRVMEVGTQVAV